MADTSETFQDHCYLEHLNDATLLHNSKQRFNANLIYTYISEILLVLNPFKTVTPADGREPATFGAGDFVTFPAGMACTWDVRVAVKKHFLFF